MGVADVEDEVMSGAIDDDCCGLGVRCRLMRISDVWRGRKIYVENS